MFLSFWQIHFVSVFQLITKHCLNLEVKISFVLSPWVKETARESNTYLSGNILPWEVWLPSFLRTFKKKKEKTFRITVKEQDWDSSIKIGWKNPWHSFQGWKITNLHFPYPQKVRKFVYSLDNWCPSSQTFPKPAYLLGCPSCASLQSPKHPTSLPMPPGLWGVLLRSWRLAFRPLLSLLSTGTQGVLLAVSVDWFSQGHAVGVKSVLQVSWKRSWALSQALPQTWQMVSWSVVRIGGHASPHCVWAELCYDLCTKWFTCLLESDISCLLSHNNRFKRLRDRGEVKVTVSDGHYLVHKRTLYICQYYYRLVSLSHRRPSTVPGVKDNIPSLSDPCTAAFTEHWWISWGEVNKKDIRSIPQLKQFP